MSLGVVMFLKAFVVTLWGAFAGWWVARRKNRALPLMYDKRTGTYRVRDWMGTAERYAIYARNMVLGVFVVWWVFLAYIHFTGQTALLLDLLN